MAYLHEHCTDCFRILGQEWPEVHRWLDGLAGQYRDDHRRHRHHAEGIEAVRQKWGAEAALAAKIHIVVDCWGIPRAIDYTTGRVNKFGFTQESTADDVDRHLQCIAQQHKK
ncbi:hypothetical protein C4565_09365 [Candidatus Parcubacteria bacterium]|nr:MAG: hypothetical protein C4565_09365 [Candidatus Parcubacteria bacterium]